MSGRPLPLPTRAALATYPPSFRERYGEELGSLVEDTGTGPRVVLDLLAGSARAWLRPSLPGAGSQRLRGRRLATVSTVWVCWCAVFVSAPALLRALEDPPPVGYDPSSGGWGAVHDAIATALAVGWLMVLAVGAPIGLRALARHATVRRVVLPPVLLLAACMVLFVPLQLYASRHWVAAGRPPAAADIPLWWALLAMAFVLALGVDAVWGTVALAVALRRADLDPARLRWPAAVAALLVVPMTSVVVLLVVVAMAGAHPSAAGPLAPLVYAASAGLLGVLAIASVSAARGLRGLRAA